MEPLIEKALLIRHDEYIHYPEEKLTPRGASHAKSVANLLKEHYHLAPSHIFSSASPRAIETAHIFARAWGLKPHVLDGYKNELSGEKQLRLITSELSSCPFPLAVIHKPDVPIFVYGFLGDDARDVREPHYGEGYLLDLARKRYEPVPDSSKTKELFRR